MNFNTIQRGDVVDLETQSVFRGNKFLGFTTVDTRYSSDPVFKNLKDVKAAYEVRTNAQLEEVGEELGYGHHVYAMFESPDERNYVGNKGKFVWGCYLYKGRWSAGSGADYVRFI